VAALHAQAGKLEKTIKSEVPPEKNDGPVVVLTAKTFNDIVFGKPRNVLIEFYAPWCVPSQPSPALGHTSPACSRQAAACAP
jgi:thiol-disulfide isomerase/thioredoxin